MMPAPKALDGVEVGGRCARTQLTSAKSNALTLHSPLYVPERRRNEGSLRERHPGEIACTCADRPVELLARSGGVGHQQQRANTGGDSIFGKRWGRTMEDYLLTSGGLAVSPRLDKGAGPGWRPSHAAIRRVSCVAQNACATAGPTKPLAAQQREHPQRAAGGPAPACGCCRTGRRHTAAQSRSSREKPRGEAMCLDRRSSCVK